MTTTTTTTSTTSIISATSHYKGERKEERSLAGQGRQILLDWLTKKNTKWIIHSWRGQKIEWNDVEHRTCAMEDYLKKKIHYKSPSKRPSYSAPLLQRGSECSCSSFINTRAVELTCQH